MIRPQNMNIMNIERQKISQSMELCQDYCSQCKKANIVNYKNKISIDRKQQLVIVGDKDIKLSNRAFRVLCALLKYDNTPVSFTFLHDYGWPDNVVVRNNLIVTISELKSNLKDTDIKVHNVRGYGYLLSI